MKQITLTQGKVTLVDDDVFEAIGHLKWTVLFQGNNWYAVRMSSRKDYPGKKQPWILMHHIAMGYPLYGNEIDHIDGNGLNNQRSNLRIVTSRHNDLNRINHRNGRLFGVSWHKVHKKWMTRILINGKRKHLGYFKTEQEAHEVYLKALKDYEV